jgi:hypothetical protein
MSPIREAQETYLQHNRLGKIVCYDQAKDSAFSSLPQKVRTYVLDHQRSTEGTEFPTQSLFAYRPFKLTTVEDMCPESKDQWRWPEFKPLIHAGEPDPDLKEMGYTYHVGINDPRVGKQNDLSIDEIGLIMPELQQDISKLWRRPHTKLFTEHTTIKREDA